MQYRISSTSHTQTAATAVATELHDQVGIVMCFKNFFISKYNLKKVCINLKIVKCIYIFYPSKNWSNLVNHIHHWGHYLLCNHQGVRVIIQICRLEDILHFQHHINMVNYLSYLLQLFIK